MRTNRVKEIDIQKYVLKKEWDKAIELYKDIIGEGGESGDIYNRLGDMYMKKGEKTVALENYLISIELYIKEELYDSGTAICSKMLRYGLERPDLYFRLAQLNTKLNLGFEAIRWFNTYLSKDSKLIYLKKYVDEYQEMITLLAGHDLLLEKVKNIYIKANFKIEALDKLFRINVEGLTEEDTEFIFSTIMSIKEYIEEGDTRNRDEEIEVYRNLKLHKQAIAVLQKPLRDSPNDIEKLKLLGLCFLENHKPRLAIRIFDNLIKKKTMSSDIVEEIKMYISLAQTIKKYVTA
ncbi:hypothetical protein KAT73_06170 [candidate division WOR-3 bacterium]|nr:hypothetical protein [candidate division WOR-3 bacterium]